MFPSSRFFFSKYVELIFFSPEVSVHHALFRTSVTPKTSQRTKHSSFNDILLLVYGFSNGHKPLHTLTVHIDIVFDIMYLCEIYNRTFKGDREYGGFARMGVWYTFSSTRSLFQAEFLILDTTYFRKIYAAFLWTYILQVLTP